ncbi:unnamed protein product [Lymnaea stagnalis]|uniref:Uncharacterized protein n=1 Tax=Lymnaea stagnalis TaxID=6523 RepID=A0AAV2IIQ0_LYMST
MCVTTPECYNSGARMRPATRNLPKAFGLLVVICVGLVVVERLEFAAPFTFVGKTFFNNTNFRLGEWVFPYFQNEENYTEVGVTQDALACVFPDINPFRPEIMKLSGLDRQPVKCVGYMPDLTYVKGNKLEVNKTRAEAIADFESCKYQEISNSPSGDKTMTTGPWSDNFTSSISLGDRTEFIVAVCENNASQTISKTYHALIPKRQELAEELSFKLKKRNAVYNPKETLNVVMIGMDGVPRNHFMRAMNKTYTFLMSELNSFDLSMHTQVGINTFPNFVALLTGSYEDEVRKWWHVSGYLDTYDLVWKDFEAAGYRTLYTEDQPTLGAFHLGRRGFKFSPTHYYSRPICLAMESDRSFWKAGRHCLGNQPEITFHYDYIKQFLETFKDKPLYAMQFQTRISHDDVTTTKMADEHTYEFYKYLKSSGQLNKTLLISFSDHGIRYGPLRPTINGLIESRAPYAIFTFPKWFLDKYPDVANNLKTNTGRLTTHFDTHATLRDLIYFKADRVSPLVPGSHGSSLFRELPKSRVCQDIPIPMEFCICGQSQIVEVSNASALSQGLVDLVLKSVNSKTNHTKCATLQLTGVVQVALFKLTRVSDKDQRVYKVKFVTSPGGALYEGTVTTNKCEDSDLLHYFEELKSGKNNNTLSVTVGQTIDRLNFYKGQADCEEDVTVKAYCYCQNLVNKTAKS